ncbi:MAG: glycosyltransferase, partial [bacterium]
MRALMAIALLVLSLTVAVPVLLPAPVHGSPATPSALEKQFSFRNAMRVLWENHIVWTRLYIVSVAADLPDKDATAQRLLRNQTDIGNAIKPFYGNAAGGKLTELLRGHILTAAELLAAAKAGDSTKMGDASTRWYANADEIATFLSGANPRHWPATSMKAMMRAHLDLTLKEAA